ncbi:Arylamine N-acetyltransferase [Kalmanozyma brasiliensis GHG001]|uniref:Uncharacterized protein n=1 Tax=Kalmanozyma brasiliensis (strain GHG001) TaxID=1365824 RepID=V5EY44_KALBG|nr:Arylamine N-acetyltransferase [Kalmanozyma brasiliensis GHG001]EST07554.1 Arylamine N-acetyltransferase [Kalmanozyma brasiliensis GHG001]
MVAMRPKQQPSWLDETQARAVLHTISFPGFEDEQTSKTAPLPAATLSTLSTLQMRFLLTFPFESLSLSYEPNGRMSSQLAHIYSRLITHRHGGGYCLQINVLYREVLSFLGFRYVGVLGRVFSPMSGEWTGFSHSATLVYLPSHVDGKGAYYLSDVGFGSGPLRPMFLRDGWEERGRGSDRFRLVKGVQPKSTLEPDPNSSEEVDPEVKAVAVTQTAWILQNHKGREWEKCYSFHPFECNLSDCHTANYGTSHPGSVPFAVMIIVVAYRLASHFDAEKSSELVKQDGLHEDLHPYHPSMVEQRMIVDDKFIVKVGDEQTVFKIIETEEERVRLLKDEFGLLGHVTTEEALATIKDKPSRLKSKE